MSLRKGITDQELKIMFKTSSLKWAWCGWKNMTKLIWMEKSLKFGNLERLSSYNIRDISFRIAQNICLGVLPLGP